MRRQPELMTLTNSEVNDENAQEAPTKLPNIYALTSDLDQRLKVSLKQ